MQVTPKTMRLPTIEETLSNNCFWNKGNRCLGALNKQRRSRWRMHSSIDELVFLLWRWRWWWTGWGHCCNKHANSGDHPACCSSSGTRGSEDLDNDRSGNTFGNHNCWEKTGPTKPAMIDKNGKWLAEIECAKKAIEDDTPLGEGPFDQEFRGQRYMVTTHPERSWVLNN